MRPTDNRLQLWPVAVAAVIIVLLLLSFDLPMRLSPHAPQEFRAVPVSTNGKANVELADQYWRVAVAVVQWKYPFGSALPHDPPPDFTLPPDALASNRAGGAARQQYWNMLRQLWSRPDLWQRKVEFDVSWAGRAVRNVNSFVSDLVSQTS